MTALFTSVSTVATGFFSWFGTVVDMIVGSPILLAFCSLAIISTVVGIGLRFLKGV